MQKINLKTKVQRPVPEVAAGFTESLFKALSPPFPPVRVVTFDGCKKGDVVSLELNFLFFKQIWTSHITYDFQDASRFEFIDEGVALPFFLGKWRHHHKVYAHGSGGSIIEDDIRYAGRFSWMTPLLYPILYIQFWYRKPIYRKIFA